VAEKVTVELVDDIDGSPAQSTVEFGLDGASYAIDLSDDNAEELRDALSSYVASGRRTGGRKRPVSKTASQGTAGKATGTGTAVMDREQKQAIREWARKNGWKVADRGRISAEIMEAYDKAHRSR
jgi:Lsr2